MKILIIGFAKIKYMPYLNLYLDNLDFNKNEVHLLYWDRDTTDDIQIEQQITLHKFCANQQDDRKRVLKVKNFFRFRKFAMNVIKKNKYDFIIVLHTLPGLLLLDLLKKKYKGKYILDYRDSTYEYFYPFKKLVHSLSLNANMTFVSSNAFRKYLPLNANILTTHNFIEEDLNHREYKKVPSDKIRIAFWGFIRHESINKEIIRKIAADSRFELHYYGREQQIALNLKVYAKTLSADNVFFHGEYQPKDRYEFVKSTDIIHNIYNDNNMMLAMANKFYDGIIFRIPQICMINSYMAERANNADIGHACNPYEDSFCNKVINYYDKLRYEHFFSNCNEELKKVLEEYLYACEQVQKL